MPAIVPVIITIKFGYTFNWKPRIECLSICASNQTKSGRAFVFMWQNRKTTPITVNGSRAATITLVPGSVEQYGLYPGLYYSSIWSSYGDLLKYNHRLKLLASSLSFTIDLYYSFVCISEKCVEQIRKNSFHFCNPQTR